MEFLINSCPHLIQPFLCCLDQGFLTFVHRSESFLLGFHHLFGVLLEPFLKLLGHRGQLFLDDGTQRIKFSFRSLDQVRLAFLHLLKTDILRLNRFVSVGIECFEELLERFCQRRVGGILQVFKFGLHGAHKLFVALTHVIEAFLLERIEFCDIVTKCGLKVRKGFLCLFSLVFGRFRRFFPQLADIFSEFRA